MSLQLNFNPHSWYMDTAIQKTGIDKNDITDSPWNGYYLNGMTGYIVEFNASTLADLKRQIRYYHKQQAERDAWNRSRIGEKQL